MALEDLPYCYREPQSDWEPLTTAFFNRPAIEVAPDLIGTYLSHETEDGFKALQISEIEIYSGTHDTASHASRGITKRTSVMYESAGTFYVYLCYGIHTMFNIITGGHGEPEGILIRACIGAEGPGKLTRALGLTPAYHGLCLEDTPEIRFWTDGTTYPYTTGRRIGISYADKVDRERLWRYILTRPEP
ncbi:MAG: DNA-3-methyladenine glycosylase [Saccharofermentanales bacterium]|jgi:DNA-3-methyladenine glycosylase